MTVNIDIDPRDMTLDEVKALVNACVEIAADEYEEKVYNIEHALCKVQTTLPIINK